MDFDPIPYAFRPALYEFLAVAGIFSLAIIVLWLIIAIAVRGPVDGVKAVFGAVGGGLADLVSMSLRRVLAIAKLTFKEAIRRKALLVFVVFAVLFMFGAWFLPNANERSSLQTKVHISFVLTAISWLLIPVMLLLACWGIPEDIRLRSLHTVVTKPARRLEIVVGRMMGYSFVGLLLLAVMGGVGYIWLTRQVNDMKQLDCRVPVYGNLSFLDREGRPAAEGLNVGDAWMFRGYIEGATKARAIWHFNGIDASQADAGELRLESMFEAFRTVKGRDMTKGLIAQYTLVNNARERAFAELSNSELMRETADFMREGQFENAAESLATVSESLSAGAVSITDLGLTSAGLRTAFAEVSSTSTDSEWKKPLADSLLKIAGELDSAIKTAMAVEAPEYESAAEAVAELAEIIATNAATLKAEIPRVEIPLAPFEVREYRDGENILTIDNELSYEGNDEDVVRFLAGLFANSEVDVADDAGLSKEFIDGLVNDNKITTSNADSLSQIFTKLIEDGTVKPADGKLELAEGQTFFSVFDQLAADGKISAADGWKLKADLFKDVINNGNLTVNVACQSLMQYIGMARPDMFIRLPDAKFGVAYGKAILAIGLMLVLIICLGVTASCFVKGPVAILLTTAFVVFGQPLHGFMSDFVSGSIEGGGMFSSIYRLFNHLNPMVEIKASPTVMTLIEWGDYVFNSIALAFSKIIPNFNYFSSTAEYVENGFDVPWNAGMIPCIVTTCAFVIPCVIIGLFTLKYRELEAK